MIIRNADSISLLISILINLNIMKTDITIMDKQLRKIFASSYIMSTSHIQSPIK